MFQISLYIKRIKRFLFMRVTPDEIRGLFKDISHDECIHLAKKINFHHYRNIFFWMIGKFIGIKFLANIRQFTYHGEEKLLHLYKKKHPVIIIIGHIGPIFGPMTGLYRLGLSFHVIMREPNQYRFPKEIQPIKSFGSPQQNISALKNAHKHLKNNGFLIAALDGIQGESSMPVSFLGRTMFLRKGISTLQQLTHSVVIPVSAFESSQSRRIELYVHDPLKISSPNHDQLQLTEKELLEQAALWLEDISKSYPDQLRPPQIHNYLSLPEIK